MQSTADGWIKKSGLLLFFIFISWLYLLHPSQDLLGKFVLWDEATIHINAKDIVLFGASSIAGDRTTFISFPLDTLLGIISFSLAGVSLLSLRLPYILLNIAANIFFFDLARKTRGMALAIISTLAFALYVPRFVMGKGAMVESLILPLTIILLWCIVYAKEKPGLFFWIGAIPMMICFEKLDNAFMPLFLAVWTGITCLRMFKNNGRSNAKKILWLYLAGAGLVTLAWLIFYTSAGWDKVILQLRYTVEGNLNKANWHGLPLSPEILTGNIRIFYRTYGGMLTALGILILPFIVITIFNRKIHSLGLATCSYLLLFILLGKLTAMTLIIHRRFAICYPLPFLLIIYIAGAGLETIPRLKQKILRVTAKAAIYISIFSVIAMAYSPSVLKDLKTLIMYPAYTTREEARFAQTFIDKNKKVLFLDGRFGYIALQLPNKCIDIPPDLNVSEFFLIESNPLLAKKIISQEKNVAYVLCRQDNRIIRGMLEKEFNARVVISGLTGEEGGPLYGMKREGRYQ